MATQLKVIASSESSLPSLGRAILTAEAMKGKTKEAMVATTRTRFLPVPCPAGSSIISQFNLFAGRSSSTERHSSNDLHCRVVRLENTGEQLP